MLYLYLIFVYRELHSKYLKQSLLSVKCSEFTYIEGIHYSAQHPKTLLKRDEENMYIPSILLIIKTVLDILSEALYKPNRVSKQALQRAFPNKISSKIDLNSKQDFYPKIYNDDIIPCMISYFIEF